MVDLARLRELAEKATPGPWRTGYVIRSCIQAGPGHWNVCEGYKAGRGCDQTVVSFVDDRNSVCSVVGVDIVHSTCGEYADTEPRDASYIAALSPDVALSLLDEIASLRERAETAERERDDSRTMAAVDREAVQEFQEKLAAARDEARRARVEGIREGVKLTRMNERSLGDEAWVDWTKVFAAIAELEAELERGAK